MNVKHIIYLADVKAKIKLRFQGYAKHLPNRFYLNFSIDDS